MPYRTIPCAVRYTEALAGISQDVFVMERYRMLSSVLSPARIRGALADVAIPGAVARSEQQTRRTLARDLALLALGALLVVFCLLLDDHFLLKQSLTLGGVSLASHTVAADALIALGMAGLLALDGLPMVPVSRTLLRDTALVAGGVLLMAIAAKIIIPLQPVPITGQTFGVLLIAAALGWRRGLTTMALYIALGSLGLPIFADVSTPATYGYLAGFALAAVVVGFLAERGWDRNLLTSIPMMLLGEVAIYLCGLPWLAQFTGWNLVLKYGFFPFVLGDTIKLLAAALLLPAAWLLTGRALHQANRMNQPQV